MCFNILFCSVPKENEPDDVASNCYFVHIDEFESSLVNPPSTTREDLQWDSRIVDNTIIFSYAKVGYCGWYAGKLSSYDSNTKVHTITPFDRTAEINMDLLECNVYIIKELRLVKETEDATKLCKVFTGRQGPLRSLAIGPKQHERPIGPHIRFLFYRPFRSYFPL